MAYLTEDNSYKLWEMISKSWESQDKLGLNEDLVYQIMQIAQKLQNYETLNQQLGG